MLTRRGMLHSAAVAVAAAGTGPRPVASAPGPAPARSGLPARQAGGTLAFALSADDLARVQPLLDEYRQQHDVTVEPRAFPYASLYETLNINLIQATGTYDVVSMDDPWIPLFAGGQYLVDLGELLDARDMAPDADFVPELLALGEFPAGTGLRGIPWIGSVQVFAYRTDVLTDLGKSPPVSWDDVLANAQVVNQARGSSDLYGIGLRGQPGNHVTTSFLPVLRGYGVDIFQSNEVFEPQLETDQARQATATFLALAKLAPPGVEDVGHEENGRNMYTGRVAQSGDIWPDQVLLIHNPELSSVIDLVEIGPEPAQPGVEPATMTGNWLLGVPVGSTNAEAALDFILWLTAPEQQKRLLLDANLAPSRVSVLQDPDAVERQPFLPGLLAAARNAVPRPRTQHYPAVEEILGSYLNQAVAGQISGEDALVNANQEIRDLMVREGVIEG